jgi:hypothetical protein
MTYRDWEERKPGLTDQVDLMCRRAQAAGVGFVRLTIVAAPWGGDWLCLDGWPGVPADQGPEPTGCDVPVGFS